MADQPVQSPSRNQSATSKPPNKRSPTTTSDTPPSKRPHIDDAMKALLSSNSEEIKDTASSEPEKPIEEVEMPDDILYQELDEYEFHHGINPVEDFEHMHRYCFLYIQIGIGNKAGWIAKLRHLKNKFKDQSVESVPDEQMEEFFLWKSMFARVPPPDAGSRVS